MSLDTPHAEQCTNPDCVYCRQKLPFELPEEIVEAAATGHLVIFAGAGVSTEASTAFKNTFYADIRAELGLAPDNQPAFPALMSLYCHQPNGRRLLLQRIKARFDYMRSFPELYRTSSRFHRTLSTLPHVHNIITTNWDDLFERECGATPLVTAEDFVFWEVPGRKVYKIHGSINNYGSIVATEEDYEKCYHNLSIGLVGSQLKLLLATRVVVFVGYSLRDDDFQRIYRLIEQEMHGLIPHCYIVSPLARQPEGFRLEHVTCIATDATFFIEQLKDRLANDHLMIPDSRFDRLREAWMDVRYEHDRLHEAFTGRDNPEMIYAASYQDGLMHAFEYLLENKSHGSCSDPGQMLNVIRSYKVIRKEELRGHDYFDVAYVDGYINGLAYLLADDNQREHLCRYYLFGRGPIETFVEYSSLVSEAGSLHKASFIKAQKTTARYGEGTNIHHIPFL